MVAPLAHLSSIGQAALLLQPLREREHHVSSGGRGAGVNSLKLTLTVNITQRASLTLHLLKKKEAPLVAVSL